MSPRELPVQKSLIIPVIVISLLSMPLSAQVPADTAWQTGYDIPGVDGEVRALLKVGDTLYVGGDFAHGGGSYTDFHTNIAIFDLNTRLWHEMGYGLSGSNARVNDLMLDPATGDIIAAGKFTSSNTTALTHIARWNGSDWSTLSGGLDYIDNEVNALEIKGDTIIIGGKFESAGGLDGGSGIAGWSATSGWIELGYVIDDYFSVEALEFNGPDKLYVGGIFGHVADTSGIHEADNIAFYTLSTGLWSALPGGGTDGPVYALKWHEDSQREMYVGGSFSMAGGLTANNIATVGGYGAEPVWKTLTDANTGLIGLDSTVIHLSWVDQGRDVLIGGKFRFAGKDSTDYAAIWDPTYDRFTSTYLRDFADGPVNSLYHGDNLTEGLYAGGKFDFFGGIYCRNLALMEDRWTPTGQGISDRDGAFNVSDIEFASARHGYVAGSFETAGGMVANGIARWDNYRNQYFPLGDGVGTQAVADITVAFGPGLSGANDTVYVIGSFTIANGAGLSDYVQMWHDSAWHPMGAGLTRKGSVIERDSSGNVYVGGWLDLTSDPLTTGIVMWDGSSWTDVGGGIDRDGGSAWVFDIKFDEVNNYLYVCGQFDIAGGQPAESGIAYWDGSSWHPVGSRRPSNYGATRAFGLGPNGDLYAGQYPYRNSALYQWSGTAWTALEGNDGLMGEIEEIEVVGCDVYVVGSLQWAGPDQSIQLRNIVRWDGSDWFDFGSGLMSGDARSVEVFSESGKNRIIVGGEFRIAGWHPASKMATFFDRSSDESIAWRVPSRWSSDTLFYGETVVFSWPDNAGISTVSLEYSSNNKANWNVIDGNIDPDVGAYVWEVPPGIDSDSVYFLLSAGAGCRATMFGPYRMRDVPGLNVQRIYRRYPDGKRRTFDPRVHGWAHSNSAMNQWPQSYIDAISYDHLPMETRYFVLTYEMNRSFFMDWNLFEETWGYDALYYDNYEPKMDILWLWRKRQGKWGGSCFGFAVTAQSFFDHDQNWWNLSEHFPAYRYVNEIPVEHHSRSIVNQFQVKQWETEYKKHKNRFWKMNPLDALDTLLTYIGLDGQGTNGVHPIISIYNWVIEEETGMPGIARSTTDPKAKGGHALFPYKVTNVPDSADIIRIYVYDCNRPDKTDSYIRINAADSTWEYGPLGWGFEYGMYPSPSWQIAHNAPIQNSPQPDLPGLAGPLADDTGYVSVYTSEWNDIFITTANGDSLGQSKAAGNIRNSDFGIPIFQLGPFYEYERATEYFFRDTSASITLRGFDSSQTYLSWASDSVTYSFERDGALLGETDLLSLGDMWQYTNPDTATKSIKMQAVSVEPTLSWVMELRDIDMPTDDTLAIQVVGDSLKIDNIGPTKFISIYAVVTGNNLIEQVQSDGVKLVGDGIVTIIPDWPNLDEHIILLLTDADRDSVYEDTVLLDVATSIGDNDNQLPIKYQLGQNYPNPFNPNTTIDYSLPKSTHVVIDVFNILGQRVNRLVDYKQPAGNYQIKWGGSDDNGKPVTSGVYFYRISTDEYTSSKKMLLLK